MDGLCAKIIENYDIDVKNIKKTKGYYLINSSAASYALRKTSDTAERIEFRYKLQENLLANNFLNIEKIYPTCDGLLFMSHDEQKYILSDHISGEEADFDNRDELSKILSKLAEFHKKTVGLESLPEQFYAEDLNVRLTKMVSDFLMLRKKISTSKSLSNFDILFLKNHDYYESNINTAAALLHKANYHGKLMKAFSESSICHNMLKKETLVAKDNDIFISMLSGISVDHFSADISMIISKYMKYSAKRQIGIMEIIDMYSNSGYNKLDEADYMIILARLLMPSVFIGTAKQYYMKKRSWAPSALTTDLEHEISSRAAFLEYTEPLVRVCGI